MKNRYKVLSIFILCIFASQSITAQEDSSKTRLLMSKGWIHSMIALEQDFNRWHFKKALEYYLEARGGLDQSERPDPKTKSDLDEFIKQTGVRIEISQKMLRNVYPLSALSLGGYEYQSFYQEPEFMAISSASKPLIKISRQISFEAGQTGMFLIRNRIANLRSLHFASVVLDKNFELDLLLPEEVFSGAGKEYFLDEILNNPSVLDPYIRSEGLGKVGIIAVEKVGDIGGTVLYTISLYEYKPGQGQLIKLGTYDGLGQNLAGINISIMKNLVWYIIGSIFIPLFGILFYLSWVAIKRGSLKIFIKKDLIGNLLKLIAFIPVLFFGIAAGYGLDYLASNMWGNGTSVPEGISYQLPLMLFAVFTISMPLVFILVGRFLGWGNIISNQFYLPLVFGMLYQGVALWHIFRLQHYDIMYPGDLETVYSIVSIPGMFFAGIMSGRSFRHLIAYSELGKRKLITSLSTLPFALFFLVAFTVLFFRGDIELLQKVFYLEFCVLGLINLIYLIPDKRKDVQSAKEKQKDEHQNRPYSLSELKQAIKNPEYFEIENQLEDSRKMLAECLNADDNVEGGVLHIAGVKGSGRSRIVSELLKLNEFKNALHARVRMDTSHKDISGVSGNLGQDLAHYPFMLALSFLPGVKSLIQSRVIGGAITQMVSKVADKADSIPLVGDAIKALFTIDTSKFSDSMDQKTFEKILADVIDKESAPMAAQGKYFRKLFFRKNKKDHRLIFIIEDFDHLNQACRDLISVIQKKLVDSKPDNSVAFIIVSLPGSENFQYIQENYTLQLNKEKLSISNIQGTSSQKNKNGSSATNKSNDEAIFFKPRYIHLRGMTGNEVEKFLYENLNFSPNFYQLAEQIVAKGSLHLSKINLKNSKDHEQMTVLPSYILQVVEKLVIHPRQKFDIDASGFVPVISHDDTGNKDNDNITRFNINIPVPTQILLDSHNKLKELNETQLAILEAAAVVGYSFNAEIISKMLEFDLPIVFRELSRITHQSRFLAEYKQGYHFYDHISREIVLNNMMFENSEDQNSIADRYLMHLHELAYQYYLDILPTNSDSEIIFRIAEHAWQSDTHIHKHAFEFSIQAITSFVKNKKLNAIRSEIRRIKNLFDKGAEFLQTPIGFDFNFNSVSKEFLPAMNFVLNNSREMGPTIMKGISIYAQKISESDIDHDSNSIIQLAEMSFLMAMNKQHGWNLDRTMNFLELFDDRSESSSDKAWINFWKGTVNKKWFENQDPKDDLQRNLFHERAIQACQSGFQNLKNIEYSLSDTNDININAKELESKLHQLQGELLYLNNVKESNPQAIESFKKSLELKRTIKDSLGEAMSLLFLSSCYQKQGNINSAITYAKECYQLNYNFDRPSGIGFALTVLIGLYQEISNSEKELLDSCYEYLNHYASCNSEIYKYSKLANGILDQIKLDSVSISNAEYQKYKKYFKTREELSSKLIETQ